MSVEQPIPRSDRVDERRVLLVSFVVPCYDEVETVCEFYKRAAAVADKLSNFEFELIFVNDGSRDGTAQKLNQLASGDPRVKVLHLARNRGHQIAITAGIDFAGGDVVITIDADLQDPPELAVEMLDRIEKGFDIVHAQRSRRKGETRFKLVTAAVFYRLMKWFATDELVEDSGDFRAISRPAIEAARCFREPHRFVRGLFCTLGFRQTIIQYERDARYAGVTKYPLVKMVKLAVNAIVNFSTAPLKVITGGALLMWSASLIYIGIALYNHFVLHTTVTGWTSLAILSTFSTGVILFCLNILGAYVARIYEQGLHRPLYWLSDIRNVDLTEAPKYIANVTECELSLAILRSRAQVGRESDTHSNTRFTESDLEVDDRENSPR